MVLAAVCTSSILARESSPGEISYLCCMYTPSVEGQLFYCTLQYRSSRNGIEPQNTQPRFHPRLPYRCPPFSLQKRGEIRENDGDEEERIGGESEKRWYPHGLPNGDEEYEKRTTRDGETVNLSASSRAALPRLKVEDISRILQDTGPLAFEMLQLTFPPKALELVRDMVGVRLTVNVVNGARECQRS